MVTLEQTQQLKDLLGISQSVVVILGPSASPDQVASALAFVSALEQQGKTMVIVSPRELKGTAAQFDQVSQIQTQLGNRDLTVGFEYHPEAVDKVSYHIDEASHRFYLVIKPQKGQPPLDTSTVEYSYTGAEADLLFLVGVQQLESLEQLYFGYEQLYSDTPVVTFDSYQPSFGTINIDGSGLSSLSESMVRLLQQLEFQATPESATNLLTVIEEATEGFKAPITSAETFETVAYLLRLGARRAPRKKSTQRIEFQSDSFATALKAVKPIEVKTIEVPQVVSAKLLKVTALTPKKAKTKESAPDHQPNQLSPGGGG